MQYFRKGNKVSTVKKSTKNLIDLASQDEQKRSHTFFYLKPLLFQSESGNPFVMKACLPFLFVSASWINHFFLEIICTKYYPAYLTAEGIIFGENYCLHLSGKRCSTRHFDLWGRFMSRKKYISRFLLFRYYNRFKMATRQQKTIRPISVDLTI